MNLERTARVLVAAGPQLARELADAGAEVVYAPETGDASAPEAIAAAAVQESVDAIFVARSAEQICAALAALGASEMAVNVVTVATEERT